MRIIKEFKIKLRLWGRLVIEIIYNKKIDGLEGMSKLPGYWVLQAAKVNTGRLRRMLQDPDNISAVEYLKDLGYEDPKKMNDDEFKK